VGRTEQGPTNQTSARSNHRAASAFAAGLISIIAISLLQHTRLQPTALSCRDDVRSDAELLSKSSTRPKIPPSASP
jgi:hypothetical protein